MKKFLILLFLLLFSCSSIPFKKKEVKETEKEARGKTKQVEKIEEEPKPGDVKVIDGVEYIYVRNRRYMVAPYEPEYIWVRKDKYSPSLAEALSGFLSGEEKKEREAFEKRLSKLEEELKKKGLSPQVVYPVQVGPLGFISAFQAVPFNFPSPKMKRRVLLLPFEDKTNYKEENYADLLLKRLISRLENTGTVLCETPESLNIKTADLRDRVIFRKLQDFNITAVIKGELSALYTSTSKIEEKSQRETSFAVSQIYIEIWDTETGTILKKLTGRNPVFLTKEEGDMSPEKARIKAIDLSLETIIEDLLKTLLSFEWHARIASIDGSNIYLNAGRLSGLKKGDILEVFSPGEEVRDVKTGQPLGKTKGEYKGEIEVVELFGLDASVGRIRSGSGFSSSDLVYLKSE